MYCINCEREIITDSDTCPICDTLFGVSQNVNQEQNIESNFKESNDNYPEINSSQDLVDTEEKKSRKRLLFEYENKYLEKLGYSSDKNVKKPQKTDLEIYEEEYLKRLEND